MDLKDMREYELVYILQPEISEEGISDLNDRVAGMVAQQEGEGLVTELWGRRTLAYEINKRWEGVYVLHRFQMTPQGTNEVDRILRFNEDVLRYLLVRTDE